MSVCFAVLLLYLLQSLFFACLILSDALYQNLYSWCVFLLNCTTILRSCVLLPFTKASYPLWYVFICLSFLAYHNTLCFFLSYWLAVLLRPSLVVAVICLPCMITCSLVCCLLPNIDFLSAEYLSVCLVDPDDRLFVVCAVVLFSFLFMIFVYASRISLCLSSCQSALCSIPLLFPCFLTEV